MVALINNDFNKAYNLPQGTLFEFNALLEELLYEFHSVDFRFYPKVKLQDEETSFGFRVGIDECWGEFNYSTPYNKLYATKEQALCALFLQFIQSQNTDDNGDKFSTEALKRINKVINNVYGLGSQRQF